MTATIEAPITFRLNPAAASAYLNLRFRFAQAVIRGAIANLNGDEATREDAHREACAAEDTAYALIVGLMLDGEPAFDKWDARIAATDYTREHFDRKALLLPPTSEPRRVYTTRECPDPYTVSIAPERVLGSVLDLTMYLFSEADARLFNERTGQTLIPLHTL